MIRLASTDLLSLVTAQNGAEVVASYNDRTATAYGPGNTQVTDISSATTTTILSSPAASAVREPDEISIKNTFAGSHTMTLNFNRSATLYVVWTVALLENESIAYTHAGGWVAMDANGAVKTTLAISASMVATQADEEAGTSTSLIVTPGRQQFHPSAAKGWAYFNASATINRAYNVTSITDSGTGDATVNWATDFSDADHCDTVSINTTTALICRVNVIAAGTTTVNAYDISGPSLADPTVGYMVHAFGDQA